MADYQALEELIRTESDEAALKLVRDDLHESYKFKRDFWPSETIDNRWAVFHGDPDEFSLPYDMENMGNGPKPFNNLTQLQIQHKVGKLMRVPTRLNVLTKTNDPNQEVRLALSAAKARLEQKAREANWKGGRRILTKDSAVQGLGIRAVGVEYHGAKPKMRTFRVRAREWHMDPAAEPPDLLDTASWCAWRRFVATDRVMETMIKFGISPGGAGGDLNVESDHGITLPDDQLLLSGGSNKRWSPENRILVTDYYRRDDTMDIYYECSKCGNTATVGRYDTGRQNRPLFECQHCQNMEKKMPDRKAMRQGLRYPFGRHIRIFGAGTIVYSGPCKYELEDVFPFLCLPWIEDDTCIGISEVENQASPQQMNMLASAMIAENAIFNTHPKRFVLQGTVTKPDNNNPANIAELNMEGMQAGGIRQNSPGQVGEAAKILLQDSLHMSYAMAGNSPEAHGAAPETMRSGIGLRSVIAASEVSLYLNQDVFYAVESRFFRIVRDICRKVDYPQEMFVKNEMTGVDQGLQYNRILMNLAVRVEVTAEREIDQEREELFSRAVELKGLQDPYIDFDLLHELSGIPPDYFKRAQDRLTGLGTPPGQRPIDQLLPGAGGPTPPPPGQAPNPALSVIQGGRSPVPARPGGGSATMGKVQQETAGRHAPSQVRPPSRSRGGQLTPPPGGGGI